MDEDRIISKLFRIEEKVDLMREEMAQKKEVHAIITTLDKQGVILQRLDQEHLFTPERIKRIEKDVEVLQSK